MALSGVDYYGSDVGGFQRSRGGIEGGGERLYTQWFAASAALDVPVRPHAWNLDKARSTAPSARGDLKANLENLRLRYRLTPYYYSLAHDAFTAGEPVFPPLVYRYASDPNVRRLGKEKLIGRDLLVTTVAEPLVTTTPVYLPAGTWVDFHSGQWLESAGQTYADRPLYGDGYFRLPLFARAGAILPMAKVDEATRNNRGATDLVVRIYASTTATQFDLKEDDGESSAYGRGEVATTRLSQQRSGDTVRVEIAAAVGTYAGMPATREVSLEVSAKDRQASQASLDGRLLQACARGASPCFTNGARGLVIVKLGERNARSPALVEVGLTPREPERPHGVLTCLSGTTTAGYAVYAVGSIPALGAWSTARALKLEAAAYPTWTTLLAGLPAGELVEWKCIRRREDGGGDVVWQNGANNRLATPESGYAGASTGSL